jgi:hypothetical protein
MSKRDESRQKRPFAGPDPDSLAMDDRGTRPFRPHAHRHAATDDGNYIGDPNHPEETIRAADEDEGDERDEHWLPPSDAPTIIRDLPR